MTSRIGGIVQDAQLKSSALIDRIPVGSKRRSAATAINAICSQLVKRRTPICPTAKLVSEEGHKSDQLFPQPQTIHNSYSEILNVWKDAYRQVMNINIDQPVRSDLISKIDTSQMDIATGNIVEHLKAVIADLNNRCNTLKQIVEAGIPVDVGQAKGTPSDAVFKQVKEWLNGVGDGYFVLDEIGIRTTRKTPIGAKLMDRRLYDQLVELVNEFLRVNRAKDATSF